mgnify:CR=1 FL=1
MVKRLVAVLLGALAGAGLWFGVAKLRAIAAEQDTVTVDGCADAGLMNCVDYEAGTAATPEACKVWLRSDGDLKALSACLHERRAREDALKLKELQRAQGAAKSI